MSNSTSGGVGLDELAVAAVDGRDRAVAGARSGSSIFIASSTTSVSPFFDASPGVDEHLDDRRRHRRGQASARRGAWRCGTGRGVAVRRVEDVAVPEAQRSAAARHVHDLACRRADAERAGPIRVTRPDASSCAPAVAARRHGSPSPGLGIRDSRIVESGDCRSTARRRRDDRATRRAPSASAAPSRSRNPVSIVAGAKASDARARAAGTGRFVRMPRIGNSRSARRAARSRSVARFGRRDRPWRSADRSGPRPRRPRRRRRRRGRRACAARGRAAGVPPAAGSPARGSSA